MYNYVYSPFLKLSKKFSRARLYEWLDAELSALARQAGEGNLAILNVGAGGPFYQHIKRLENAKIVQIDIDPGRKPDVVADVCDLGIFPESGFDAVFMMEVLEHVREPWQALKEIRRVLKPGGILVLSVPFIFPIHDEPHDYYRFTKYGLAYLLRDYKNVSIRARNDYLRAIMVLFARSMVSGKKKDRRIGVLLFAYALVQYPLLWLFSRFYRGDTATTGYFVVAESGK